MVPEGRLAPLMGKKRANAVLAAWGQIGPVDEPDAAAEEQQRKLFADGVAATLHYVPEGRRKRRLERDLAAFRELRGRVLTSHLVTRQAIKLFKNQMDRRVQAESSEKPVSGVNIRLPTDYVLRSGPMPPTDTDLGR